MQETKQTSAQKNTAGWVLTGVIGLLIAAVVLAFLYLPFSSGNLSVTGYCGNLAAGGAVTDFRGDIYFAGAQGKDLYSVNQNGSFTKIADGKISHINIERNRFYYLNDGIPTCLKNMVAVEKLSDVKCTAMSVNGSWIYYTDTKGDLYKMTVEGKDVRRVGSVKVTGVFAVDAGYVYYTDAEGLKKIRTNGQADTEVLLAGDCTGFFAYDRYVIYYQAADGVYSISADDGSAKLLRAESQCFNYGGGRFVYAAEDGVHYVDYSGNAQKEGVWSGAPVDALYLTTGDKVYYYSGSLSVSTPNFFTMTFEETPAPQSSAQEADQ